MLTKVVVDTNSLAVTLQLFKNMPLTLLKNVTVCVPGLQIVPEFAPHEYFYI